MLKSKIDNYETMFSLLHVCILRFVNDFVYEAIVDPVISVPAPSDLKHLRTMLECASVEMVIETHFN